MHQTFHNSLLLKNENSIQGQFIYVTILVFFLLGFISLNYLKTTISVKSQGLFQSAIEKTNLTIPVNGVIKSINLIDNQKTIVNDTLLVIDASLPEKENDIVSDRVKLLNNNLQDL